MLELLRRKFDEMMAEYRSVPQIEGHEIVSTNWPEITVRSGQSGQEYVVNIQRLTCTCRGFRNWGRCKHVLFIIKQILDGNLELPEGVELEAWENISRYLRGYSHRQVEVPLMGELYGIEIELTFKREVGLNVVNDELKELFNKGFLAERDGSLPDERGVELKSPILNKQFAYKFVSHKYWQTVYPLWDRNYPKQGNHIHISADIFFDTNKIANSKTMEFLWSVAKYLESKFNFYKVFGRRPNQYCRLAKDGQPTNRYMWINITNLRKRVGKTIEVRGFKTNPLKLPENLFKAKFIANLFWRALLAWRAAGRPEPEEWLRNNKLFSLLTREERFFTALALEFKPFPEQEQKKQKIIRQGVLYELPVYQED